MATQTCWRCTSKLLTDPVRLIVPKSVAFAAAAFSTTTQLSAANAPRKGNPSLKGKKTLRLSKNKREPSRKAPEPGERRALRERIVLSNTNAFEVPGLKDLSAQNYADKALVGTMAGLAGDLIDPLRAIMAFKTTQRWNFFRRPATLYRRETLELANHIRDITAGRRHTVRRIITGERGSGKSLKLLQAQSMALLNRWVVIHIPNAHDLVNAHTAYALDPDTNPPKYLQKTHVAALLSRIAQANEPVLSNLTLTLDHNLPIPLQSNLSLTRLAETGARDAEVAWPVFQALWAELTNAAAKGQPRPPVLLTLDGLPHVTRPSEYLAPNMHFIHAFDLRLVEHFISYLNGSQQLPNGGMVLAADTDSNRPAAPSLDLAMQLSQAGPSSGLSDPLKPWARVDERVVTALRDVQVMRVGALSREEAKAVLEFYARSGMLRRTVTQGYVSERWTLAGGGIFGELEKGTLEVRT